MRPHRDQHPATRLELLDQRRWNVARCCCDDDRIERRILLPPVIAVADLGLHITVTQILQALLRLLTEWLDDFNGVDRFSKFGEDCRLVSRAGTDFEHSMISFHSHEVGHYRDDIRLGNGLAIPNGKRAVLIGVDDLAWRHKFMAFDFSHRREHTLVKRCSAGLKTRVSGHRHDLLHHSLPQELIIVTSQHRLTGKYCQ